MLATVSILKKRLGIPSADTSKDDILESILAGASAFVERRTNRKLEFDSYEEKLDGNNSKELILSQYPINEVTLIKIDGVEMDVDDFDIDSKKGRIFYTDSYWPKGRRNIEIEYSAGYLPPDESGDAENVPKDLEDAVLRIASRTYERRTAEGVSSVSTGGFNSNFNSALDEDIKTTLSSYRKIRV